MTITTGEENAMTLKTKPILRGGANSQPSSKQVPPRR
jgi:hypothetical protein